MVEGVGHPSGGLTGFSTVGAVTVLEAMAGQSLCGWDAGISVRSATPRWRIIPLGSWYVLN